MKRHDPTRPQVSDWELLIRKKIGMKSDRWRMLLVNDGNQIVAFSNESQRINALRMLLRKSVYTSKGNIWWVCLKIKKA